MFLCDKGMAIQQINFGFFLAFTQSIWHFSVFFLAFFGFLLNFSCSIPGTQPESSITIYNVERELASFVYLCQHRLY